MYKQAYLQGYMSKEAEWPEGSEVIQKFMASLPEGKVDPSQGEKSFHSMVSAMPLKMTRDGLVADPASKKKVISDFINNPQPLFNILKWWSSKKKNPYGYLSSKRRSAFNGIPTDMLSEVLSHVGANPDYLKGVRKKYYQPTTAAAGQRLNPQKNNNP